MTTKHPYFEFEKDTFEIDEFDCASVFLLVGRQRALVIDTGIGIGDLKGLIRKLTDKPLTVALSHGHGDHSGTECISLRQGAASPFTVETIDTWHDDKNGAKRGPNTIHILSDGQCRIAHLGDLGCDLTLEQKDKLRRLTALLIPVGGFFTINAAQAKALVDELAPTVAIPMHYRGRGFGYPVIGKVDKFTKLCGNVITYPSSELELSPQTSRQTAVLKPENT